MSRYATRAPRLPGQTAARVPSRDLAALELRRWVAAMWDDHLDRCGLGHTKPVDRAVAVESFATILEAHAEVLAADAVAKGRRAVR